MQGVKISILTYRGKHKTKAEVARKEAKQFSLLRNYYKELSLTNTASVIVKVKFER